MKGSEGLLGQFEIAIRAIEFSFEDEVEEPPQISVCLTREADTKVNLGGREQPRRRAP